MNHEEKKAEILAGFEDYLNSQEDFCVDNLNIMEILPKLLKLQNQKGLIYGRSWCKHSDMSAFFNLERKWDRIYNIMVTAMKDGMDTLHGEQSSTSTPTETFVDTITDLALYSLMWVGYIRECNPDEFEKFVAANQL